jgi:hypothetical protein
MIFVRTFDAVFILAAIVWELFTLRLIAGLSITLSPIWNLCEGIGASNRVFDAELTKAERNR